MAVPSVGGVTATFANPSSPNPGALTVTNVPDGPAISVAVTLKVTGVGGCMVTSNTINVTVNPSPPAVAITPSTGGDMPCTGGMYTYSVPNNPTSSYSWQVVPGGNTSISALGSSATITWGNTIGNYNIFVQETDANGCNTINVLPVTTKQTPVVNPLSNLGPYCPGDAVPLVNLSSTPTADSFSWTVSGDGTGATAG
jgi:hypothetical protein